ncbi:MAG: type I-E CRISPR-associated protein Cas7/Cse4/CasC [Dactylosporangium sp.]|nr:type I-E CRISPR-associated protein Cas7/Cse4/CasC [Dactylosporangium sp.]NNJ63450.1 type I-E CRISPR-associated protein Cas7/Cse4/CasC [Dactylosporangium sp.]
MTARTYVDIHVVQTVPPCNLNRDDAGSPKQAVYGGVRRTRVSSQAWKRATRVAFEERLQIPQADLGVRTKRIAKLLADRLAERTGLGAEAATRLSTTLLADLKVTPSKKQASETSYLLFFGRHQLETIIDLVADRASELADLPDKDLEKAVSGLGVRDALKKGHPIDVALFGRMVADLAELNVDAATQVAHALSTHATEIEFDYYTAVDDDKDRSAGDDAGAGMIGTVEFTSATLYRYATVGLHQLAENLDGDPDVVLNALAAFLQAFVFSMPTGHENSFAHRTVPNLISVVIRDDQPVNLVSAFERPVLADGHGIASQSILALAAEKQRVETSWGLAPLATVSQYNSSAANDATNATHEAPDNASEGIGLVEVFGSPVAFGDLVRQVTETVRPRLAGSPAPQDAR